MDLSVKQRVTLFRIDDMMAMTHRYELEVRQIISPSEFVGYHKKERVAAVRQKGKRKDQYLDLGHDDIVLNGWDVPFKADTECAGVMHGNACYNFVGNADTIKDWIENHAARPVSDSAKAKIVLHLANEDGAEHALATEKLLYPEIDCTHAVINRIKEAYTLDEEV